MVKMSLEEKALLLSGDGWWKTHALERLEIPSIYHDRRSTRPPESRGRRPFDQRAGHLLSDGFRAGLFLEHGTDSAASAWPWLWKARPVMFRSSWDRGST